MIDVDFFSFSGPRSSVDRKKLIEKFDSSLQSKSDFGAYGYDYFDNSEYGIGYGGYQYDGRYGKCVEHMISHYNLEPRASILELGCAKGFILTEFLSRGMNVTGIDASKYACENAFPEVKPFVFFGSCATLSYEDNAFDLVYSKEVLPHLTEHEIAATVSEAKRVCKTSNIFFEIQVGNGAEACGLMKAWDFTHKTMKSESWWRDFLRNLGFHGQVNFKPLF